MFSRQAIRSALIFGLVVNCVLFNHFVIAQPSKDSNQPSRRSAPSIRHAPDLEPEEDQRVKNIKDQITQNKQVKVMCANYFNNITFELVSDQVRVDTGNNFCAYTIVKEVLQPKMVTGQIRTYELTGDREGVIVSF